MEQAQRDAIALLERTQPDELERVLQAKREEQETLDGQLRASTSALEELVRTTKGTVQDLARRSSSIRSSFLQLEDEIVDHRDLLVSPISARRRQHAAGLEHDDDAGGRSSTPRGSNGTTAASSRTQSTLTLLESFEQYHHQISQLEQAERLLERLAKSEELSLIACEQIKLPDCHDALKTYCELVEHTKSIYGINEKARNPKRYLASALFVRQIARHTSNQLRRALDARMLTALDGLSWPTKKLRPGELDYEYDGRAKAFKKAFMDLQTLETTVLRHPLPEQDAQQPKTAASSATSIRSSFAVSAMGQPLILRFRYHFDGKRQTNRLDKPEWYFAHILNALSDHEAFIRGDVQDMLSQAGNKHADAMADFIATLLRPLERKVRASVPQLLDLPSVLAHTIYQALQFDATLRETFSFGARSKWPGTADIVLGDAIWFGGWKDAEKKFIDDRYFEIISSADAWHINEDFASGNSNVLRPTNSALRTRDLFDQVTDRYRPLPSFRLRLPFLLDIQLPMLESYLQRISSATDAFETLSFGLMRAVPGSLTGGSGGGETGVNGARLTNGINGLQRLIRAGISSMWIESACKEWAEDVFFLDLWQEIKDAARMDVEIRQSCRSLLDTPNALNSLFDGYIEKSHALSDRIEELIVKHVTREIQGELKKYLARRWDQSFQADGSDEITPDLVPAIAVFSALLSTLSAALPTLALSRIYRHVTAPIQELILTRGVLPKIWSEAGGRQFLLDVEKGWVAAAREATRNKIKRPENGLRRLLDAARLVSLPSSTTTTTSETSASNSNSHGASTSSDRTDAGQATVPIARLVQVTWDDTNDSAFLETLEKIGVRELNARKDVKAILRKRPECWR